MWQTEAHRARGTTRRRGGDAGVRRRGREYYSGHADDSRRSSS